MRPILFGSLLAMTIALGISSARADIRVVDDGGATVTLPGPARRIISLAPHVTELLFAAGAGDAIVGTVEFSDHPAAAKGIPRVGTATLLDMERIVELKPDLIVVWLSGNPPAHLDRLRTLGVPIFRNEPRQLDDIGRALLQLGALAGTDDPAQVAASAFAARAAALRMRYANRSAVPLFWQVWARPLLTINGRHLLDDVIRLCGGRNVFATLRPLVPAVSVEAVVEADPEAIVTTRNDASNAGDDGLDTWRALKRMRATAQGNLVVLDADSIHRSSPRILDGADALCQALEGVRSRRPVPGR